MRTVQASSIGTCVVALFTVVGVMTSATPVRAQGQGQGQGQGSVSVTVVNPLPLPVTGTVNVASGQSITVNNPATQPVPVRDVAESAKELFQIGTVSTQFSSGAGTSLLVTVPAGKRLVIEHASVSVNVLEDGGLTGVALWNGIFNQIDDIPCQPMGANSLNHFFSCSMSTKYYVDAEQGLSVVVGTLTGGGFFRAFVSGYYIPVP